MPKSEPTELHYKIVDLWNSGHSAGVIKTELGLTRNIVMGVVTRMRSRGLITRSIENDVLNKKEHVPKILRSINRRRNPKAFIYKPKPAEAAVPIAPPPIIDTSQRWVSLINTGYATCRFSEDGKTFCNSAEGFPYCPEHRKRVYVGLNWSKKAETP